MKKSPAASLTIWFNVLVLAAALPEVQAVFPKDALPYLLAFVAFGNMALRYRTTTGIR